MATIVHCDGCGFTEPDDLAQSQRKIKKVTVTVEHDPRESFPEAKERNSADLCPDCQGRMLHEYFGIRAEGQLETPAFLAPRSLKAGD